MKTKVATEGEKAGLEKKALIRGGAIIALVAVIGIVMGIIWGALIGAGVFILVSFLVLYLVWAPHGIFAFFLEEGYAKIVMRGESFHRCYIKYQGKVLLSNLDVVDVDGTEKAPFNIMGMVPLLWPFYRVYTYQQRWVKFKDGVKIEREELLDHVILMPYVYGIEIKDAETKGKVPVNMGIVVEATIFNPYKAMFQIKDWNSAMTSWVEGAVRDFVSKNSYEQLLTGELATRSQNEVLEEVAPLLATYGVRITNISVIQVAPSNKEYEKATQQKVVEERKMEAILVRARADAQKEAIARMGSALHMVASATGQSIEALTKELGANPVALNTKYKEQFKVAMDLVNKNMAIDGKAYFEMNLPNSTASGGGQDFSSMLGAIITANKIIEQQKTSSSSSSKDEEGEQEKIYSEQEIRDLVQKIRKQRK